MLLSDIRDIRTQRPESDRSGSSELASILGSMEDRPWSEWGRSQKPITASALSRLLSPFGIPSGTRRVGGETFKGYLWSDFDEAFASYLPEPSSQTVTPSQRNNDGHFRDSQSVTPKKPVTVLKSLKPNNDGHCDGVTLLQGGSEEKRDNDLSIPTFLDRRAEVNGNKPAPRSMRPM
jgi:putative DNA primase/helicase